MAKRIDVSRPSRISAFSLIILSGVMPRLLRELHNAGILTEDLALPEDPDDIEASYRGLCRLPHIEGSKRRRIDILSVAWKARGAALLYFTVCFLVDVSAEYSFYFILFTCRVTILYVA
jgi:hypothetical protein